MNRSARRHAQELIDNLHLIREAYFHLNDLASMNTDFANYLSNQFTSCQTSNRLQNCRLCHESKSDDKLVRLLFRLTEIKYYQTLYVGKIRLCTRSYDDGKVADNSNIIFLFDGIAYPGKIRTILTIEGAEPYLLVGYMINLTPLTCQIDEKDNFAYHNILSTATSKWNYISIEVKNLVEKSVYFRSFGEYVSFPTIYNS
jgi:hypothetical protein